MLQIARTRMRPLSAIVLALALAAVAVVLASQSTDATSAPTESPVSKFDVLEPATGTAMDAVPAETRMRLELMAHRLGLSEGEGASAVGVVDRSDEGDVTVAAMGDAICAFIVEGLGTCAEGQQAASGQSFSAAPVGCKGYQVLGLAPDGVTSIAIDSQADGSVDASLPVRSNVYVGVLDSVRTVATGLDEAGNARFTVAIPLDSYASMNEGCG